MHLYLSIACALLSTFQLGVAFVVVNTMLDDLSQTLDFDKNVGGDLVSSIFLFGCGIGGLVCGIVEKWANRFAQSAVGFVYFLGSLLCGFSNSASFCWGGPIDGCAPYMLFFGRLLIGIAGGMASIISPKYMAKVAPPKIRGLLGVIHELALAAGVLWGFLMGLPYEFESFDIGYSWWRVTFLSGAVLALLQIMCNWLALFPTKEAKAKNMKQVELSKTVSTTSQQLRELKSPTTSSQKEHNVNVNSLEIATSLDSAERTSDKSWKVLFDKKYRRCVLLASGVPIGSQLSGMNVIAFYSTIIFDDAGFERAIIGSIILGVVNFMFTCISAAVFEKFNRKTVAYFSYGGMGFSLLGVAFSALGSKSVRAPLSVVFIVLYMAFFGSGCATFVFCYAPEIVPSEVEHVILGTGQALSYAFGLLLVLIFPSLLDGIGALPSFFMLAFFAFGTVTFLKVYMVETRNKALEMIHKEVLND